MGYIPEDFICEECGSPLEYFDGGTERLSIRYPRYITYESWRCVECGKIYSNEPDFDNMREE